MTISSSTRKAGPFTGNGVTTAYPFAFKVFSASDLLVVLALTSTGAETVQTITTNYTVALNADQSTSPGGTVTMLVAPAAGYTLTLTSQVANLQPTDLTNAGGFYPKVINDALDRATIQIQQLAEKAGRALQVSVSTVANIVLPAPSAGNLLGWDATGSNLINIIAQTGTSLVNLASSAGSSLVGFTQSGTGAVARTVQDKARESVSVLDFYANGVSGVSVDPTGAVDSTLGIQAAINSIVNSGKPGVLNFGSGTFKLTAGLTIDCGFVSCKGNRAVLDFSSVGNIACLTFTGGNPFGGAPYNQADFQFESFNIKGPGRGTATAIYLNQVSAAMGPSHTAYRDLNISEFYAGIRGGNHSYLTLFDHVDVWNCTKAYYFPITAIDGSALTDYGANYTFLNGTLYGNDDAFQSMSTQTDYTFLGTTFGEASASTGRAVFLAANSQGALFSGCHFESTGQHIYLGSSGNATLSGCTFLSGNATQDKLIENHGFMTISGGIVSAAVGNTNVIFSDSRIHITNLQKVSTSSTFYTLTGNYWKADVDSGAVSTSLNLTAANIASFFDSQVIASVSVPTGSATAFTTLPTIATTHLYLVSIQSVQGNAAYSGFAIVATDVSSARIVYDGSGSQAVITASGLVLSITQSSGGTKSYAGATVRIS